MNVQKNECRCYWYVGLRLVWCEKSCSELVSSSLEKSSGGSWIHIKGFLAGTASGVAKLVVGHPFE